MECMQKKPATEYKLMSKGSHVSVQHDRGNGTQSRDKDEKEREERKAEI